MLIKSIGSLADYKSYLLDIQVDLKAANDAKFRNVEKIAQSTQSESGNATKNTSTSASSSTPKESNTKPARFSKRDPLLLVVTVLQLEYQ